MHTMTLQINDNSALKTLRDLETRHMISILDTSEIDSPSLPGGPMRLTELKDWIKAAENTPSVSLNEAKAKWAGNRKLLRKLIK